MRVINIAAILFSRKEIIFTRCSPRYNKDQQIHIKIIPQQDYARAIWIAVSYLLMIIRKLKFWSLFLHTHLYGIRCMFCLSYLLIVGIDKWIHAVIYIKQCAVLSFVGKSVVWCIENVTRYDTYHIELMLTTHNAFSCHKLTLAKHTLVKHLVKQ